MLNACNISELLPISTVVSYTFRVNMSMESSAECSCPLSDETITDDSTDTLSLLQACISSWEFNAVNAYLKSNKLRRGTLDGCLQYIFKEDQENYTMIKSSVMEAIREGIISTNYINESGRIYPSSPLRSVETIKLLLQLGAKWSYNVQLKDLITPYHIICRSTKDNSELLDLMIESTGRRFLNTKDSTECTPLMYAVRQGNINCVKSLITHGADVNVGNKKLKDESFIAATDANSYREMCLVNPLIESIMLLYPSSKHSSVHMIGIFDLLLENGVDINTSGCDNRTPLMYAAAVGSTYCSSKLTEKGARHDRADDCGRSVMYWAVVGGNISTIHYLLQKGVTVENFREVPQENLCHLCEINTGFSEDMLKTDPCMKAVWMDKVDVVQLIDEHRNQAFQSFAYLPCAVMGNSGRVLKYLLSKHNYPLNHEYVVGDDGHGEKCYKTLLVEACTKSVELVRLLLEHGADPNRNIGKDRYPNAIATAIMEGQVEMVACLIRSGSNVNSRLWHNSMQVSSFELSILKGNIDVVEMLLLYGCFYGVFSLETKHNYKDNVKPDVATLMKNWNVNKNNVIPLQKRCRVAILNHMSPATEEKITKLPLPSILKTYLTIPELGNKYI